MQVLLLSIFTVISCACADTVHEDVNPPPEEIKEDVDYGDDDAVPEFPIPADLVNKEEKLKFYDQFLIPDKDCRIASKEGDWIEWHYIGKFLDGKEFASGLFSAFIGKGEIIPGVDQAMRNLCIGDKRRMVIHSDWAYGDQGTKNIPGGATL